MSQEVLGHDARYLLKVVEDGEACILTLSFFGSGTKLAELIVRVESCLRFRFELILSDGARVAEDALAMQTLAHESTTRCVLKLHPLRHARIMDELFLHRCARLRLVDWEKACRCELVVTRAHNVFRLQAGGHG